MKRNKIAFSLRQKNLNECRKRKLNVTEIINTGLLKINPMKTNLDNEIVKTSILLSQESYKIAEKLDNRSKVFDDIITDYLFDQNKVISKIIITLTRKDVMKMANDLKRHKSISKIDIPAEYTIK